MNHRASSAVLGYKSQQLWWSPWPRRAARCSTPEAMPCETQPRAEAAGTSCCCCFQFLGARAAQHPCRAGTSPPLPPGVLLPAREVPRRARQLPAPDPALKRALRGDARTGRPRGGCCSPGRESSWKAQGRAARSSGRGAPDRSKRSRRSLPAQPGAVLLTAATAAPGFEQGLDAELEEQRVLQAHHAAARPLPLQHPLTQGRGAR